MDTPSLRTRSGTGSVVVRYGVYLVNIIWDIAMEQGGGIFKSNNVTLLPQGAFVCQEKNECTGEW